MTDTTTTHPDHFTPKTFAALNSAASHLEASLGEEHSAARELRQLVQARCSHATGLFRGTNRCATCFAQFDLTRCIDDGYVSPFLTARDVEMLRMAAAVLDGSHDYDAQTVAAVAPGVADALRAIARAHCSHVRIADGVCRHCDAQLFEVGDGEAPHSAVGSQHAAADLGPTSAPDGGAQ